MKSIGTPLLIHARTAELAPMLRHVPILRRGPIYKAEGSSGLMLNQSPAEQDPDWSSSGSGACGCPCQGALLP